MDSVADLLGLDDEQRRQLATDQTPSHAWRSVWSLSVLKKAGLLANPSAGYWTLTDQGRQLLTRFPRALSQPAIVQINRVWWKKKEEVELKSISGTGQGLGLNAAQRKAIEIQAMKKAAEHLKAEGWSLKNTSSSKPYDYVAKRGAEKIIVEVKGTTGDGQSILLTANEVDMQLQEHPQNALIVVHSISLNRRSNPPTASRGQLRFIRSWRIVQDRLVPKVYQYQLEDQSGS